MKKIVVALEGGLGNQMFQYAAGRALSLRVGAPLALDLRPLLRQGQRAYGLGVFRLGEAELITEGKLPGRAGKFRRWLRKLTGGERTFREARQGAASLPPTVACRRPSPASRGHSRRLHPAGGGVGATGRSCGEAASARTEAFAAYPSGGLHEPGDHGGARAHGPGLLCPSQTIGSRADRTFHRLRLHRRPCLGARQPRTASRFGLCLRTH
ncbi:MAG: hypothetical protein RJB43_1461 [Verrucomicrobiota bacterium]